MPVKRLIRLLPAAFALLLAGCDKLVLLDPEGHVARQQSDIMISTTIIIALIIVPVLIAIGFVAWRYRAANKKARYDAKWDHSPQLELLVWALPLLIIIAVGAVSWIGTHQTDPYRPLQMVSHNQPVNPALEPLVVDVVSLRWKWLFFYPQYGIATVNELAAPVDRPINFRLTSSDMMDAFFVPDLAGMIYTMPGMQTKLHAVINQPGKYQGMSANYSGAGFTDMRFWFYGMGKQDFAAWVDKVRAKGGDLSTQAYLKLSQPSRAEPVHYYEQFVPHLYARILHRCVIPGQVCMGEHMAENTHGKQGGEGHAGMAMPMSMDMSPSSDMHSSSGAKPSAVAPATH